MRFIQLLGMKFRWWWWKLRHRRLSDRMNTLLTAHVRTEKRPHPDLVRPLSYQDGHFEHYIEQERSAPKPFVPPPDIDDGLN